MLTVDAAIIRNKAVYPEILLIKRGNEPFKNYWALPGGFVDMDETLDEAIKREVAEECNIENIVFQQFKAFGNLNRDPRGRTVSIVYYTFLNNKELDIKAGDDAAEAKWFSISALPELAFDHKTIIDELNNFLQMV